MKRRTVAAFFPLLLLFVSGATAEEKVAGLTEALRIALANNHEVRAFGNSVSARREDVGIAASYLLPKITFEERFMRTTNPTYTFMAKLNQERFAQHDFDISSLNNPKAVNDFQTSLSFEQPLFSRRSFIGLDMARKELSSRTEEYLRKKQEIALKVVQAYFGAHTAGQYGAAAEKAVEDAREHLRIAELRYRAGLGLYSDALRASTALADAEQRLVSARKNLDVSKRALGLLLAMTESVGTVSEDLEIPLMSIEYYTAASQQREDIRSLQTRYENAENGVRFAESGYLPVIGIGGSYQLNDHRKPLGAEGESWQFVAFFRWELFDGMKREHERARAKYQTAEAAEHLEGLRKAVSFRVFESYLSVKETLKNAELARAALRTAQEGKRLVKVRYESGLSPLVDLLDAQVSLDHARATLIARENEHRVAILNLGYESGTILRDLKVE